ncbi:MAG: hypothetical protein U0T83_09100 [Bacteriovoracaceae bacterium]
MNILFFSPNQGIWPFTLPESLIANSLKLLGHKIIYLNCQKLYKDFCLTQNSLGLKFNSDQNEKNRICNECINKRELVVKKFRFENYYLNEFISEIDKKSIVSQVENMNFDQCFNFAQDGIAVGKKALYEFLLNHKKSSLDFSEAEISEYKNCFKNCWITFNAINVFLKKHSIHKVIMFNTLYSVNSVVAEVANKFKIDVYTLHAGLNLSDRYQKILFGKNATVNFLRNVRDQWTRFKQSTITQDEASYVAAHFLELFKGENNYAFSSVKSKNYFNIREKFLIPKDKKIIVALMSSYDEQFANLQVNSETFNMIFPTQIEWMYDLINFFKNNPELFLIIRVHPREFPRHANAVLSEHARKLQHEFTNLPENVKINWPHDNVSLYDLMEETDLFLSAWSSSGKEMSFFGRPVIIYSDDYIFYPHELNIYKNNKADYFNAIKDNLKSNFDFERIRMGFRWFAIDQNKAIIDIGDLCKIQENRDKNIIRRVFKKVLRTINSNLLLKFDLLGKNKKLKSIKRFEDVLLNSANTPLDLITAQNVVTFEDETQFIKDALKKIYFAMYGSETFDHSFPETSLRYKLFKYIF